AKLLSADGALLRFGGRVMKNVAGFDVSRLLCGSLGTLGIITEISLKVLPRPRAEETLRLQLPAAAAVESFNRWSAAGLAVSGAARWPGGAWVRLSVPATTSPLPLPGDPLIDWGGALRWYADPPGEVAIREIASAAAGTALCWRGPAPQGRFHPLPPALARLHRRLKERFDPHGIFNPGRLLTD